MKDKQRAKLKELRNATKDTSIEMNKVYEIVQGAFNATATNGNKVLFGWTIPVSNNRANELVNGKQPKNNAERHLLSSFMNTVELAYQCGDTKVMFKGITDINGKDDIRHIMEYSKYDYVGA